MKQADKLIELRHRYNRHDTTRIGFRDLTAGRRPMTRQYEDITLHQRTEANMKKLLIALVLLISLTQPSQAESVQNIAERKARIAATRLIRGHVGGSLGGARFEGVGWGTSPQLALRKCCYSGRRPIVAQAVYRGRDGYYYACRLYR